MLFLFQIRDWLTVEEEMLRKQAVVVGDVGEIMEALDKQMVSRLSSLARQTCPTLSAQRASPPVLTPLQFAWLPISL